jgi:Family of unknown function (DUF5309)
MAIYTSYDQVGIKEDISAIITNLSPTRTPGQTMIGSGKTKNRVHQWQEDSLVAATQANALVEGADASFGTLVPTVMRSNNTQILGKSIQLSDTSDVVDTHGRDKETAYQLRKVSAELKRDLEIVLFGTIQAAVTGSSSVARKMANALTLIDSSTKVAAGTAALSEAFFMSAAEAAYTAGAEPSVLMIKPTDSTKIAAFASATGRLRDIGNGQELTMVIEVLRTPYGTYKVTLNRFQSTATAFLLDPDMWKLISLRPWFRETLAKTGDSVKMSVLGEYTLEHKALAASGAITGLT